MESADYIARCREAATAQGLDPAVEALVAAKVPHSVEQTGGFVMLITSYVFPREDGSPWVGVSCEEGFLVVGYQGPDDEGTPIASGLDAEEVPHFVVGFHDGVKAARRAYELQVEANDALGGA